MQAEEILIGCFVECQSIKKVGGRRSVEGLYQALFFVSPVPPERFTERNENRAWSQVNKESSFEPPADLLAIAKKATWNYSKERQWSEWKHVEETPVFQRYDMLIWLLDKSEYQERVDISPIKRKIWDLNSYFRRATFPLRIKENTYLLATSIFQNFLGEHVPRLPRKVTPSASQQTTTPSQISLFGNKSTWELCADYFLAL